MLCYSLFSQNPHIVKKHAGEFLFHEGEPGQYMYVLTRGQAEILLGDEVIESAEIGTVLGEMAVLEPGPRSASVRAVDECEFVEIDQKRFDYLVAQTPDFATSVMRIMAARLRKADASFKAH
jgi:CRP-like cAMP-binding protein